MATVKKRSENKKARRRRRIPGMIFSVLLLAVISVAAAVMITNNGRLDLEGLKKLFEKAGNTTEAAAFSFNAGAGTVYADLDGGLAVGTVAGLQVYDADAALAYENAFEVKSPAVTSGGKIACVYDLGGSAVKVFDKRGIVYELTAGSKIISASLNENGWLALCRESTGVYKGTVSVYDPTGKNTYNFNSYSGYVISAMVSPDNGSLAVLVLGESGSKVVFYALNSEDEKASCQLDNMLAFELRYLHNGNVMVIGDGALVSVRPDGSSQRLTDYTDKYLVNYVLDSSGLSALVINDYMVGDQGNLITLDKAGNTLGKLQTTRKILWLSSSGDSLAVLYSDGLVIYDRYLKERARFDETAGAEQTIMRSDGTALLILPHSATVCTPSDRK
jgi:hypothetical protein